MQRQVDDSHTKRISLVNAHGDNFGDFLNLESTIQLLRRETDFKLVGVHYSPQPWKHKLPLGFAGNLVLDDLEFKDPKNEIFLHLIGANHECPNSEYWLQINRLVQMSDFILSVPSGQSIGPYRDYKFLAPFVSALINEKPFGMLFGTAHFSGDADFDMISSYILGLGSISVRDRASAEFLKSFNFEFWGPADSSFLYAQSLAEIDFRNDPIDEYVCLILGDSLSWHPKGIKLEGSSTVESLAFQISKTILASTDINDKRIVLLAHSPLEKEVFRLGEISNLLGGNLHVIAAQTLEEYTSWIRSASLVVSLRYHGAVIAVANNVSTIAIAYEEKTSSFMLENSLAKWCISLDEFSSDTLRDLYFAALRKKDFSPSLPLRENPLFELNEYLTHIQLVANDLARVPKFRLFEMFRSILGYLETQNRVTQRYSAIAERNSAVAERDIAVAERNSAVAERDIAVAERNSAVAERNSILNSTIWALFAPYRKARSLFRRN